MIKPYHTKLNQVKSALRKFSEENLPYHTKLNQVKSALRKFSEGKDHDCDSFLSDVSVLYKSCVSRLVKWITLFAEFKCFDQIPPFANN